MRQEMLKCDNEDCAFEEVIPCCGQKPFKGDWFEVWGPRQNPLYPKRMQQQYTVCSPDCAIALFEKLKSEPYPSRSSTPPATPSVP